MIATANNAEVHNLDWRALASVVEARGGCDLLAVDAPYSSRVHDGHDGQVAHLVEADCTDMRNPLNYRAWGADDVRAFVEAWHPITRGWMISVTDHVLARAWEAEMERVGRYVFPWLPFVAPGSRVRLAGDGPSCWTTQIVVARPRTREMARWGTLPGAYVLPPGHGGAMPVVGGKPIWLMESLCRDYSRPSDLVVDPCCGAGTTLAAAIRQGRRAIGGDIDPAHAALAAQWIANPHRKAPSNREPREAPTLSLFGAQRG